MKKCVVIGLILILELYGLALLGYFYSISSNTIIMILLIVGVFLTFLTSVISIKLLVSPKRMSKRKVIENWKKCPYFIDKYDYMENPEYIDRSIK